MTRKLTAMVALRNPENGSIEVFGPDAAVPDWAEPLITNPNVWADVEETDTTTAANTTTANDKAADEGEGTTTADANSTQDEDDTSETSGAIRPAENESKAKWVAYATSKGLTVPADATKAKIIEMLEAE
ncbi:hypothetical protein [Timonella senegalensis]|uniref:hypothetical protein n=1 Tax=Timonella senegalensis TaxID=1465825 RepID=UPI0002D37531|nr:hypothetical protein [Timonella senegalensis]